MEKIITLEKERKERNISNCLSYDNKIKLNLSLTNAKFFEKAVSELSKKIFFKKVLEESNDELLISNIQGMIEHFKVEVEYLQDVELIELVGRVQLKYTHNAVQEGKSAKEYAKGLIPINCIITDKNDNKFEFYSLLRANIGSKAEEYSFGFSHGSVKIVDFFRMVSQLYIFNETINYFEKNEQICIDTLDKYNNVGRWTSRYLDYINKIIKGKKESLLDLKTYYLFFKCNIASITRYTQEAIGSIFKEMAIDNQDIIIQEEQLSEMNTDYAKSFEIKKNINKETEKAMKESTFNEDFKEVEFDNDTDLIKIKQLEDEFKDTLSYLNPSESITKFMNEVTLRFRYLGHHKAAGLYFPSYKTICIDLRDPSSFLHEFMHMIDFHGDVTKGYKLSSQYDFRKITRNYVDNLDDTVKAMPDESAFKKRYNGKNKFNKNYYCNGAEIFARCGEIYLKRILKIDNSLIGELNNNEPEYMINEELEKMIKEYYSQIFTIEEKGIEKTVASRDVSAPVTKKVIATNIATKVTDSGQLSFIF